MAQKRLVEIVLQGKDESKGAFDSLAKSLGITSTGALKFAAAGLAIGAAMVKATAEMYQFTSEMAKAGDTMDKLSLRTGEAVEELSALDFALQRSGGSSGDLEPAMRRLARSMGDARDGIKEASDAFFRLGIQTSQLVDGAGNLRSIEEILPMVANGLRDVSSQADRMDIAQALLGRGGTMLLPMLQEGAEGIRAMRIEMEKYGGTMSTTFADKSAEFVDSQTNLANATDRLKEALAEPFLGPFTNAVNKLAKAITDAKNTVIGDGSGPRPMARDGSAAADATGVNYTTDGFIAGINPDTGLPYQPWEMPGSAGYGVYGRQRNPIFGNPNLGGPSDPNAPTSGVSAPRDWTAAPDYAERVMNPDYDISGFDWGSQEQSLADMNSGMERMTESMSEWSAAGQIAAATFQSAMAGAFASAIMDADNAAEAIASIFAQTFSSLAGSLLSAGIFAALGLPVAGPFAAVFGAAATKSVSAGTKSMPGQIQLTGSGTYINMASQSYGKAYI